MKELTLEKFEEAAELVRNVTLPTNLEYSESLSSMPAAGYTSSRRTCSIQVHTKSAALTTRSPH